MIFGGRGADLIAGQEGADILWGGKGGDSFVFVAGDGAVDLIMDFNPKKDHLLFAGIDLEDVSYGRGVLRAGDDVIAVFDGNPLVTHHNFDLF